MTGGNDFFEVTKGFHNALHGDDLPLDRTRTIFSCRTTSKIASAWRSKKIWS